VKLGPDHILEPSHCLNCKKELDACSVINEDGSAEVPDDGDITICIYCGHVMAFDKHAKLRQITDREMHAVAGDPRLVAISQAIAKTKSNVN